MLVTLKPTSTTTNAPGDRNVSSCIYCRNGGYRLYNTISANDHRAFTCGGRGSLDTPHAKRLRSVNQPTGRLIDDEPVTAGATYLKERPVASRVRQTPGSHPRSPRSRASNACAGGFCGIYGAGRDWKGRPARRARRRSRERQRARSSETNGVSLARQARDDAQRATAVRAVWGFHPLQYDTETRWVTEPERSIQSIEKYLCQASVGRRGVPDHVRCVDC